MNKAILITIGITILLLLIGVWVYLLIFGTPKSTEDVLYDIGVTSENVERPLENNESTNTEVLTETFIDVSGDTIQQITTRPVAGFMGTLNSSSTKVFYAERGTGHVYAINLATGEEEKVSGTTLARVVSATFSEEATSVILTEDSGTQKNTLFSTEGSEELYATRRALPPGADNITFKEEGVVWYTLSGTQQTDGFEYTIATQERKQLFTLPLSYLTVLWGTTKDVAYPNPAPFLTGGLYTISKSNLREIFSPQYNFIALREPETDSFIVSYIDLKTDQFISEEIGNNGAQKHTLPITVIPEKCTYDAVDKNIVWCAGLFSSLTRNELDNWYKGLHNFSDSLWRINIIREEAELLSIFTEDTGRQIDVVDMQYLEGANKLLFTNKIDDTLWVYDTKN